MLLVLVGIFFSVEAVVALLWLGNDKWLLAQILRLVRLLIGSILILIGFGFIL